MVSWILRTDASAIPIEPACSNFPGITNPSRKQSKKRSTRIWGDNTPAISGYQIVSAANRTVECITSTSVVEERTQEMQRVSALQASQSIEVSSKIRGGSDATRASGMCSTPPAMTGTQPKCSSTPRTPERRCSSIHLGPSAEGRGTVMYHNERASAVSLCVRYLMVARVRMEGGVWYGQL